MWDVRGSQGPTEITTEFSTELSRGEVGEWWYADRMSEQIAIRIPNELAQSLEELVANGRFETKAEAIRTALQTLLETERRRRVGELIAAGYRRTPQEDDEVDTATSAAIRSIQEEPW